MTDKQMHWATIGVMLIVGFLAGYLFREIAPAVSESIPRSCTYQGNTYKPGSSFPAGDGCNTCTCMNGGAACTLMACLDEPTGTSGSTGTGVITPVLPGQSQFAKIPDLPLDLPFSQNPKTVVPVKYIVEHRSALNGKAVNVKGIVVANQLQPPPCTDQLCPQMDMYAQPSITLADTASPSRNQLYDLRITMPEGGQMPADQYKVGTTITVMGQVSGYLEGVMMSFGLSADDPVRY